MEISRMIMKTDWMKGFILISVITILGSLGIQTYNEHFRIPNIIENSKDSIVTIIGQGDNIGSGFFIRDDGFIATSKHLTPSLNSEYSTITSSEDKFTSKVVYVDEVEDIAILKVESDTLFNEVKIISNPSKLKVGEAIISIGNPLGEYPNSLHSGIISGLNRKAEINGEIYYNLIQTDISSHPGFSGGPVLNLKGEVISINTLILNNYNSISLSTPVTREKIDNIIKNINID